MAIQKHGGPYLEGTQAMMPFSKVKQEIMEGKWKEITKTKQARTNFFSYGNIERASEREAKVSTAYGIKFWQHAAYLHFREFLHFKRNGEICRI